MYHPLSTESQVILLQFMIEQADYVSLSHFIQQYPEWQVDVLETYIQLGQALITQDMNTIEALANTAQMSHLLEPTALERKLYSYMNYLQIQLNKREYADYLRGITPLLVDVFRLLLVRDCIPNLDEYIHPVVKPTDDDILLYRGMQWTQEVIESTNNIIRQTWQHYYGDAFNYEHYLSSSHLLKLIEHNSTNEAMKHHAMQLRQIEKKIRNLVAHETVHVDIAFIKERIQCAPEEVHTLLIETLHLAGLTDPIQWQSLSHLNQQMIEWVHAYAKEKRK